MKKISKYFSVAALAFVSIAFLASCEDEDKVRVVDQTNGGFVKFVDMPEFRAGADPSTASFSALVEDPNQNVVNYSLRVRGTFPGAPTDTIAFRSTTTFPLDVSFTAGDMATLFNVPVSTFNTGNSFRFFGTVTTSSGLVYDGTAAGYTPSPDGPEFPGQWNGGMTDTVLLTAAGLLQALNYNVTFTAVPPPPPAN